MAMALTIITMSSAAAPAPYRYSLGGVLRSSAIAFCATSRTGIDCFSTTFLPGGGGSIGGRSSAAGSGDMDGTNASFKGGSSARSEKLALATAAVVSSGSAIIGSTLNPGLEAGFAVAGAAAEADTCGVGFAAGAGFAVIPDCAGTLGLGANFAPTAATPAA